MDKTELKGKLDKSIQAYVMMLEKTSNLKGDPEIEVSNKVVSFYKMSDNYSVYFNITYTFKDIEFLDEVIYHSNEVDEKNFEQFSKYTFNENGVLVKRTKEFNDEDDICCVLVGVNHTREDNTLVITLGQEFNVYRN
jgi:hypothetical protein